MKRSWKGQDQGQAGPSKRRQSDEGRDFQPRNRNQHENNANRSRWNQPGGWGGWNHNQFNPPAPPGMGAYLPGYRNQNFHPYQPQWNGAQNFNQGEDDDVQIVGDFAPIGQQKGQGHKRCKRVMGFLALTDKIALDPAVTKTDEGRFENGGKFRSLAKEMWQRYRAQKQTGQFFENKIKLWGDIQRVLADRFGSDCHTMVFGSTLNGFGSRESDMDLCIFRTKEHVPENNKQRQNKDLGFLGNVRKTVRKSCPTIHKDIELIPAKVPILKLYDNRLQVDLDISTDSPVGSRNTHLLFFYSQLDWRVAPLVQTVKAWAKSQSINDASQGSLSSYSLTLMVINFLQVGMTPPVLPVSLQEKYPERFNNDSDIIDLDFTNLPDEAYNQSQNKMSLGVLFSEFFRHFADNFDFSQDVSSVRTARMLDARACQEHARAHKNAPGQWDAHVLVEEPYDRSNAGRATCRRDAFDDIINAFKAANQIFKRGKSEKIRLEEFFR